MVGGFRHHGTCDASAHHAHAATETAAAVLAVATPGTLTGRLRRVGIPGIDSGTKRQTQKNGKRKSNPHQLLPWPKKAARFIDGEKVARDDCSAR